MKGIINIYSALLLFFLENKRKTNEGKEGKESKERKKGKRVKRSCLFMGTQEERGDLFKRTMSCWTCSSFGCGVQQIKNELLNDGETRKWLTVFPAIASLGERQRKKKRKREKRLIATSIYSK